MNTRSAQHDMYGKTKVEVIGLFKDFAAGKRQSQRVAKDLKELEALPEGEYSVTHRQRIGHRYVGDIRSGEEVFSSTTIDW